MEDAGCVFSSSFLRFFAEVKGKQHETREFKRFKLDAIREDCGRMYVQQCRMWSPHLLDTSEALQCL